MGSKKTLGKVLRCARIACDYTIMEVAELAQISQAYILSVEKGTRNVSIATIKSFSKVYKLTSSQLMELVEYYDGLETDELTKYQLTLIKILEIILNKPSHVKKKDPKTLCKILKIARKANFISLEAANVISGVSYAYISQLERGERSNISTDCLTKLADAYILTVTQIEELADYYEELEGEEERKFRLTFIKTLEMIEYNSKNNQ